jgi:glycosyltransferase involved in cell wall biosynthesis
MTCICITPRAESGGVASFRMKFEAGLRKRGIDVTYDPARGAEAVLVLGGTRGLLPLWTAKRRGLRLVQRLDGVNWVQRVRWSGLRYTLRAEYGNALLAFIRKRLAGRVIYQSRFVRGWWEAWYGAVDAPGRVIWNGVDLEVYAPVGQNAILSHPPYRLLVVEGSLAGGLDTGLRAAVQLAETLSASMPVELLVAGKVDARAAERLAGASRAPVQMLGVLPREQMPALMRSAHLLFSAEINPPCPNSVIEALACGLPVIGFETGSLRELVGEEAGRLVSYGGDEWKLAPPDVSALALAAREVLGEQAKFRAAARARAESVFGLDAMVEAYLEVLLVGQLFKSCPTEVLLAK